MFGARAKEMHATVQNLWSNVKPIRETIGGNWKEGYRIADASGNLQLQFFSGDSNTATWDGTTNFSAIFATLGKLMSYVGQLLPFARAKGVADLLERAVVLANVVDAIRVGTEDAQKLVKEVTAGVAEATRAANATRDQESRSAVIISKLNAVEEQATKTFSNISATVARVEAINANAEKLEQAISAYSTKFETFQQQLDKRLADIEQAVTAIKTTGEENTKREAAIDKLTQAADGMIKGATTAGLASSLEEARGRYETQRVRAQIGFVVSVVVLILFILPLAAQLMPDLIKVWLPSFTSSRIDSPYALAGNLIILVPATWMTIFFAKQYAQFFSLERQYGHKATLAKSVDDFKRQAEKFQQEIAMSVFLEVQSNPAIGPEPEAVKHPIHDSFGQVTKLIKGKAKGEE